MKKSKMTKKALIISVSSMFVCILMLIGSTFAWFTDTVEGGQNSIKAGNLDIALYHTNGKATKEIVNAETKLFEVALWEPGAMAYETFEIANEGELSLKYKFAMELGDFNTISDSGKSLKDVLKVAVVDGSFGGTRADALSLNFDKTLADFKKEETLDTKGTKNTFSVVIYWEPTEADNDYNLSGTRTSSDGNPLSIELGISLIATQNTFEKDSFGNDYDDTTVYKEVTDFDSLNRSIYYAKEGEGVRLANDITFNYGIPQSQNGKTIIDLNGHTLKVAVDTSTVIDAGKSLTIKNGNLELQNRSISSATLSVNGTLNLEGVDYTVQNGAGIFPAGKNALVNIVNSTIETNGIAIMTNANSEENHYPTINVIGSTINGTNDGAGTSIMVNVPCTLNIEKSNINGYMHGLVVRGGTATVKNSIITNSTDADTYTNFAHYFDNRNWGTGNAVNLAALTIGNKDPNNYQYPSNVTLINTKVLSKGLNGATELLPTVYMIGNESAGLGATINYDEASSVGEIVRGNEFVTVNAY